MIEFRNMNQLNKAVDRLAQIVPRKIAIYGIPDSGLMVATMLAFKMGLPLCDSIFDTYPLLIVDDSVCSGRTIERVRKKRQKLTLIDFRKDHYAAIYVKPGMEGKVDSFAEIVPTPRLFEWNVLRHKKLNNACMDIDGILCRDPTEEETADKAKYRNFVMNVPLRFASSFLVGSLVTSRLARWEKQTRRWLGRKGVRYNQLVMKTNEKERHYVHKSRAYQQSGARLFIESSKRQSEQIFNATGKPVYCTETKCLYQ